MKTGILDKDLSRVRITISGLVQGVGFRPFIYRLARKLSLTGWVKNSPAGVMIEIEGQAESVERFLSALKNETPPQARIDGTVSEPLSPLGYGRFTIEASDSEGETDITVPKDLALCEDCRRELLDASNPRYHYPFINCTNCGPRFSIIESMPYDRAATTMKHFRMCRYCESEYNDPLNRRFHAQPVACPKCGPHVEYYNSAGYRLAGRELALEMAARTILDGAIVAMKGLGGFQLLIRADSDKSIMELRRRKHRPHKPLALMYRDINDITRDCLVNRTERELLLSTVAPIVLLDRRPKMDFTISGEIAPGLERLGVMLPYTPLHLLLMNMVGMPLVVTSGNRSGDPICTDNDEAIRKLNSIADFFLVHDRPIARVVDDSVVQVINNRLQVIRLARGYAPHEIRLERPVRPAIAAGGHLKSSLALSTGHKLIMGQHIGDLDTRSAQTAWKKSRMDLEHLYRVSPDLIVGDLHPDYGSTRLSAGTGLKNTGVQHHLAHLAGAVHENGITGSCLGIIWDGSGYGTDGTVWGGEFLRLSNDSCRRLAHWKPLHLPGGEKAIKHPSRLALSVLFRIYGRAITGRTGILNRLGLTVKQAELLISMITGDVNCPRSSGAGRLFDAASALLGICRENSFEGRAAMLLEEQARKCSTDDLYPVAWDDTMAPHIIDWNPLYESMLTDIEADRPREYCAAKFHNSLTKAALLAAGKIGEKNIVLSGGCFQNRLLVEKMEREFRHFGFKIYRSRHIPPNDGGLSAGQLPALNIEIIEGE